MTDEDPLGPTQASSEPAAAGASVPVSARGYRFGDVIGRGGMGEVLVAHDERIDRDVAWKRMREASPSASAVARFLREAKIQARLDHPAIVPVHELGEDDQQRPYFTMKRVTGVTLATLLGDASATRQRLLRAFVDVCLAIARAHALGIVHRDVKPSNVMLGDFGEVYVLDWGVARVLGEPDADAGAIVGTPGYMAPEQARGDEVGPASDVYALGRMLSELLARDAERAVAPELDVVRAEAMAPDPAARPTARAMADRVQAYLDGDRDLERRRALAGEHLASARTALAADDRATAIYEAGRAFAIDAASEASELLRDLIEHKPRVPPPEVIARYTELDRRLAHKQYRDSVKWFALFYLFIPFVIGDHMVHWWPLALAYAAVTAIVIHGRVFVRDDGAVWAVPLVLAAIVIFALTRITSPFLIVPGVAGILVSAYAAYPPLLDRWWLPQLVFAAALAIPIGLEYGGVLTSTWSVRDGTVVIASECGLFTHTATEVFLACALFATMVAGGGLARRSALDRRAAQRDLELRAWHLRQLVRR